MTSRNTLFATAVLLLGLAASAGQEPPPAECAPAEGESHVARIRWNGPEGTVVDAIAVVVSYPTESFVVPGTGTAVPADTRVEGPPGAMVSVSDENGDLRILVANPRGLQSDFLARVRLRRCTGMDPPAKNVLRCRVADASDDSTNALGGIGCTATLE